MLRRSFVLVFLILGLAKVYSQDISIDLGSSLGSFSFYKPDNYLRNYGLLNFNHQISVNKRMTFGKLFLGIGVSTFNYKTDFSVPVNYDPLFPSIQESRDQYYLTIPVGVKWNVGNYWLYIPTSFDTHIALKDYDNMYKSIMLSINSGVGFLIPSNSNVKVGLEPRLGYFISSVAVTKITFQYGFRVYFEYLLK